MLKVKDIMSTDLLTVTPGTEVTQAAKLLVERHINGIPVVDADGKLQGISTQQYCSDQAQFYKSWQYNEHHIVDY